MNQKQPKRNNNKLMPNKHKWATFCFVFDIKNFKRWKRSERSQLKLTFHLIKCLSMNRFLFDFFLLCFCFKHCNSLLLLLLGFWQLSAETSCILVKENLFHQMVFLWISFSMVSKFMRYFIFGKFLTFSKANYAKWINKITKIPAEFVKKTNINININKKLKSMMMIITKCVGYSQEILPVGQKLETKRKHTKSQS